MTEADFLLKRLFLAPLDFLSPFRPIASWPHGRHPEILIDCPSGFTFHFSMAFLGFSSIFLGFFFIWLKYILDLIIVLQKPLFAETLMRLYVCWQGARRKSLFHQTVEADASLITGPLKMTPFFSRLSGVPHSLCCFGLLPAVTESCSSSVTLGVNLSFYNSPSFISKV